MQPFNRILVVLDGYEDLPAADGKLPGEVNKALRLLGNSKKAELFLLTCGYEKFLQDSYYNFGDELKVLREEHCKRLEEKLGEVAELVAAQGFSVSAELAWGFPRYEQIIKKSIDCSADLVVQRTRPYGKIARTFLTNDSWQLVRYCPKPLLLVKDRN